MTYFVIYMLLVPVVCMILGFIVGRKYGWHLRDNAEKAKDVLESIKKSDMLSDYAATMYEDIKGMNFNIIGIKKKKEEPLSLKEQLQKAIADEDYELAARIHNEINRNKTK